MNKFEYVLEGGLGLGVPMWAVQPGPGRIPK